MSNTSFKKILIPSLDASFRTLSLLVLALAILLGSGCAVPIERQKLQLEEREACCDNFGEIEFQQVSGKKFRLRFDDEAPVFQLTDRKTLFQAIVLPPMENEYFDFKSYFNGVSIGQYFDPIFIELDTERNVLNAYSISLRFYEGNLFGDPNAHMRGAFMPHPEASYLVIFSNANADNTPSAKTSGYTSVTMIGDIPVASTSAPRSISLDRAPTGDIKFQIRPIEQD